MLEYTRYYRYLIKTPQHIFGLKTLSISALATGIEFRELQKKIVTPSLIRLLL